MLNGRRNQYGGGGIPRHASQHRPSGERTVNLMGVRLKKKQLIALTGLVGSVGLIGPEYLGIDSLRRVLSETYATPCITNVYIDSLEEAVMMPPLPVREDGYVPTHIQLCYEWLRRDALDVHDYTAPKEYIIEHRDICNDWSAPTYTLFEAISSNIVQAMTPRWRYVHQCSSQRVRDEGLRGFNWATILNVFSEAAMNPEFTGLVDAELFKEQCKACLGEYSEAVDDERVRAKTLHHCLAFPEQSTLYPIDVSLPTGVTEPRNVPLPSQPNPNGNVAPISSVVKPLRARLHHAAQEWANVTDAPAKEPESGTVVLLDVNTAAVPPPYIRDMIPATTTSISIMASPLCLTTHLPDGTLCKDYAQALADDFLSNFPQFGPTGDPGTPGVRLEFPASSAALFSRPILANKMVCPPDTISCLPPAMAKKPPTSADIGEGVCAPPCPGSGEPATKFFDKVGTNDVVTVTQLPDDAMPPNREDTPEFPDPIVLPPTDPNLGLSDLFPKVRQPTTGDGNPKYGTPPKPKADPQVVKSTPSLDAYKGVESELPGPVGAASTGDPGEDSPMTQTPNVVPAGHDTEKPVTPQEVADAVRNNEPILKNTNTYDPDADPNEPVDHASQVELEGEENNALEKRELNDADYEQAAQQREQSSRRVVKGADGAFHHEIPCPTTTDSGNAVETGNGIALTADPGGDTHVCDGNGCVTFEGDVTIDNVEATPHEVVRPDGTTETVDAIEAVDTKNNETIVIPAEGELVQGPDGTIKTEGTNLGSLTVHEDEETGKKDCLLVTEGPSRGNGKGNNGNGNGNKKVKTVITGECKETGPENIPVSQEGTATVDEDGGYEVTRKEDIEVPQTAGGGGDGDGFVAADPNEANVGDFQIDAGREAPPGVVTLVQPTMDSCKLNYNIGGGKNPSISAKDLSNHDNAIQNVVFNNDGTVSFDTFQTYKADTISWVAVAIKDRDCSPAVGGREVCIKVNEVAPSNTGAPSVSEGRPQQEGCGEGGQSYSHGGHALYPRRTAMCVDGEAIVDVFIHDGMKSVDQLEDQNVWPDYRMSPSGNTIWVTENMEEGGAKTQDWVRRYMDQAHPTCEASQDFDNKCWYRYKIDCSAAAAGGRRRLSSAEGNGSGRSLLRGLIPKNVFSPKKKNFDVRDRILFAKNILEKCPELDSGNRIFNNFRFGFNANNGGGADDAIAVA